MLALPLLVLPLQNLGDTYHYGGDYGAPNDYRLVKTNAECASGDLKLGEFATVAECAAACRQSACRFFIYGHDYEPTKRGHCWHEFTYDASCAEGWEEDGYDFYELVWTPPAPPPAAPPGLPWAHGFAPVRDAGSGRAQCLAAASSAMAGSVVDAIVAAAPADCAARCVESAAAGDALAAASCEWFAVTSLAQVSLAISSIGDYFCVLYGTPRNNVELKDCPNDEVHARPPTRPPPARPPAHPRAADAAAARPRSDEPRR